MCFHCISEWMWWIKAAQNDKIGGEVSNDGSFYEILVCFWNCLLKKHNKPRQTRQKAVSSNELPVDCFLVALFVFHWHESLNSVRPHEHNHPPTVLVGTSLLRHWANVAFKKSSKKSTAYASVSHPVGCIPLVAQRFSRGTNTRFLLGIFFSPNVTDGWPPKACISILDSWGMW